MEKKPGNAMKLIPILFSMAALAILSMLHISYLRDMDVKDQMDLITREYILIMETKGYLTSEDEGQLLSNLEEAGVCDVNLSGSTRTEVGYGNPITLSVEGYILSDRFQLDSLFDLKKGKERIMVQMKKTSTAKH